MRTIKKKIHFKPKGEFIQAMQFREVVKNKAVTTIRGFSEMTQISTLKYELDIE